MSPTVFKIKGYRFYFLSNEELRMHVHIECEYGEAKFWVDPIVSLADYVGLNKNELSEIQKIVEENRDEIIQSWKKHFKC